MTGGSAPMHLLRGRDPVVLGAALRQLVDELVGDADRALVVEELSAGDYFDDRDQADVGPIVQSAQTPPFLADRRIVVAREAGVFGTADAVRPLVDYLEAPSETSTVVLVWEPGPRQQKLGRLPKSLVDAVARVGGTDVDTTPPTSGKARGNWLGDRFDEAAVTLTPGARKVVADRLGEDVGRVGSLLETLESTYGPAARLDEDEVLPFLGEGGGLAPWALTDAIDAGDITEALDRLHRLLGAADRHPIGILYSLHGHYRRMLALDGADVADEAGAAELLGISRFPAKKALQQARRLGTERISEAIRLLAETDLVLKGEKGWPPELALEVLVARLAQRARLRR